MKPFAISESHLTISEVYKEDFKAEKKGADHRRWTENIVFLSFNSEAARPLDLDRFLSSKTYFVKFY